VADAVGEARPWRRALAWLLLLGPFFFASYGFATWVSGQRSDVGVILFAWERHIPLLPWTIVPYWLIDLLYGVSLFLCSTRRQLDTHAWRLLACQLIAVSCFLLFPLRCTFERGEVTGAFGGLFALLTSFDQPYNQAPSLHIALLVVLLEPYLRAVPRAWHGVVHAVALLIGVSVLTTWQHHFFDIPTGLWLGCFAVWLFPTDAPSPLRHARLRHEAARRRLALAYAGAALASGWLAFDAGGAWLWLLWPAGSLALVAVIYLSLDGESFAKRADGFDAIRRALPVCTLSPCCLAEFPLVDPQARRSRSRGTGNPARATANAGRAKAPWRRRSRRSLRRTAVSNPGPSAYGGADARSGGAVPGTDRTGRAGTCGRSPGRAGPGLLRAGFRPQCAGRRSVPVACGRGELARRGRRAGAEGATFGRSRSRAHRPALPVAATVPEARNKRRCWVMKVEHGRETACGMAVTDDCCCLFRDNGHKLPE
jgi:hypothetical protein